VLLDLPGIPTQSDVLLPTADPLGAEWFTPRGDAVPYPPDVAGDLGAHRGDRLELVIHGEPASKANSRQLVTFGTRPASIKSKKARDYEKAAIPQVRAQCRRLGWTCKAVGKFRATLTIFYASERPDLDESVILDVLQQMVYANDRQVRERHVYHAIDRENPRAEIVIEAI
jgi:Holliday junction resolvase RusA-like endonuclease